MLGTKDTAPGATGKRQKNRHNMPGMFGKQRRGREKKFPQNFVQALEPA
jgi:hypothetical protein